ncbi:MAG: cytochrome c biogenesis protein CcsA [Deinococcus sp.]|uniref:cytochrome c biogenesis protein CcsA n=1 Tax=Deinococcus sp. TaxID=47478 RepID=UPI0026DACF03|nr:cytochrome c biogenesis protein CcsA [Deinococcus sp.]MDO4244881.1 cytochrome c biogenesis protein CcsA [Deinococcus sp.]
MKDRLTAALGGLGLLLLAVGLYLSFVSPPDINQKELVRIYYLHVPAAWTSYLAYIGTMIYSLLYLIRRDTRFDRVALSSAEIGVLMTALALFSGSLWAKPTWGTYWTWDPRLTTTAVGLLIYIGYFIIRGLIDDPHRRARVAAVLGIVGTLYIPINYMSVYWWRSIHQTPTVKLLGKLELSADPRMMQAFFTMLAAFTVLYFFMVRLRGLLAKEEERRELEREEAQLRLTGPQGGL